MATIENKTMCNACAI